MQDGNKNSIPNSYIGFIVAVIGGNLPLADALLKSPLSSEIFAAALKLVRVTDEERDITSDCLFRGLCMHTRSQYSTKKIKHLEKFSFCSFTTDPEVACWFADPDSFLNVHRIDDVFGIPSKGYLKGVIVEYKPKLEDILWHPRFRSHIKSFEDIMRDIVFGLGSKNEEYLVGLSPQEYYDQIMWGLNSQSEVILKPFKETLKAKDFKNYCKSSTEERDSRFAPSWAQKKYRAASEE